MPVSSASLFCEACFISHSSIFSSYFTGKNFNNLIEKLLIRSSNFPCERKIHFCWLLCFVGRNNFIFILIMSNIMQKYDFLHKHTQHTQHPRLDNFKLNFSILQSSEINNQKKIKKKKSIKFGNFPMQLQRDEKNCSCCLRLPNARNILRLLIGFHWSYTTEWKSVECNGRNVS